MDTFAAIRHLARAEALRGLRPITDAAELDALAEAGMAVPRLRVARDPASGRLTATGHGHTGHDNEGRMPFLCAFMNQRVLPYVSPGAQADVCGEWRVELHDSHSYLPRARQLPATYANCMAFARPLDEPARGASLLPDPYQMGGYGGMLGVPDRVPWAAKRPALFFAGTTTGDRDPARNERIAACVWALRHPREHVDFRITNVAQMEPGAARAAVPEMDRVLHPPVPHEEHHRYRYQVNIAGNTACWSRVPMVLASGSVLVNLRTHADILWYYPLLREDVHLAAVGALDALPAKRAWLEANPAWCARVVADANRFVADHLSPLHAAHYTVSLLEAAAHAGRA